MPQAENAACTFVSQTDDISGQRIALSPRLGLDVAIDDVVANGLASSD
ncbi:MULTISPECIES: hypothetical protein [unclassified Bradyrhizobium]|nr:hypothetical protein [Bradyrhizobium sp. Rc2d]